jgi:hypothetical protein
VVLTHRVQILDWHVFFEESWGENFSLTYSNSQMEATWCSNQELNPSGQLSSQ